MRFGKDFVFSGILFTFSDYWICLLHCHFDWHWFFHMFTCISYWSEHLITDVAWIVLFHFMSLEMFLVNPQLITEQSTSFTIDFSMMISNVVYKEIQSCKFFIAFFTLDCFFIFIFNFRESGLFNVLMFGLEMPVTEWICDRMVPSEQRRCSEENLLVRAGDSNDRLRSCLATAPERRRGDSAIAESGLRCK